MLSLDNLSLRERERHPDTKRERETEKEIIQKVRPKTREMRKTKE